MIKNIFLNLALIFTFFLGNDVFALKIDHNHLLFSPNENNKLKKSFKPINLVNMKDFGIEVLRHGQNEGKIRKIAVYDLKDFQDFCYNLTGKKAPIRSGYRNFFQQQITYRNYGKKYAALSGTSEHQLGLGIDFGFHNHFIKNDNMPSLSECLIENSYKFGFILSYGKENNKFAYEPWHFRYIGKVYTNLIKKKGLLNNPHIFLENADFFLKRHYLEKIKERSLTSEYGKQYLNEISQFFSLKENLKASIFLKRQVLKYYKTNDSKNYQKYKCASNYLKLKLLEKK